ncbi:glutamate 5-kinase [Buchananella felis]|uniref:glutamate 5-kinase n=1 Tax=Buchananella felis TaxID=3231492 RepID=UPI003527FB29
MVSKRELVTSATRIVVKIGSSSLTRPDGGLDLNRIDSVASVIGALRMNGQAPVLVSSGAMAAGRGRLGLTSRPRELATAQACSAVGQGVLMARWTESFIAHRAEVGQVLLTAEDLMRREHYTNAARALERLVRLGVVPIINENDAVATEEMRFGDNDRLSALVAQLLHADVLVMLTDVDGLYDRPPSRPGAKRIGVVRSEQDLAGLDVTGRGSDLGTGGMASKIVAASAAASAGVGVVLTSADNLAAAVAGEEVGTWFEPTGRHAGNKRIWMAHAASPLGALVLDEGAVRAVTEQNRSLLAAGIAEVKGEFVAGDVVDLLSADGGVVARGIAAYGSGEVRELQGMRSADFAAGEAPRPVVHRDHLAILR